MIRFSDDGVNDGRQNMAADVALLEAAEQGQGGGRVYQWDGVWVSLGLNQTPEVALRDQSVRWVVRPTGGKAVLHGHDLTIGFAVPLVDLGLGDERRLKAIYRAVCEPLIAGLTAVGIPAALGERTPFVRNAGRVGDCFAHISPNDIVDPATGQKTCGCALKVTHAAVLVQASVPVGRPDVDPAEVLDGGVLVFRESGATRAELAAALDEAWRGRG